MRSTSSPRSFLNVIFETVSKLVWLRMASSFQGRLSSASSPYVSLFQTTDGVMSLALCPQAVSQAPQHFRASETQAIYDGCFACQSVCSVIFLHSGMSRAVHPQEFTKADVGYWHIYQFGLPIPLFTFCSKLTEPVRRTVCVVWLSPFETIQRRASVYGMGGCFHLDHQAGGWDRISCTVFMDSGSTLFGLWRLSHQCTLRDLAGCCFLEWEAWSPTPFCLLALLDSAPPPPPPPKKKKKKKKKTTKKPHQKTQLKQQWLQAL